MANLLAAAAGLKEVWFPPPAACVAEDDAVHVWRACLDVPPAARDTLWHTLSPDERTRAGSFHRAYDRARFIVARGYLRVILGRYLARPPDQLRFVANAYGKPALVSQSYSSGGGGGGGASPHFSVSHSRALALYALTGCGQVGIDLEYIQHDFPYREMAERFFSPREAATLLALPAASQCSAFFAGWTRKEAYLKARGVGLSLPLDQFDVSLAPGEPPALLRVDGADHEAARWSLYDLRPDSDYAAAVAVEGHDCRISRYMEPLI